VADVLAQSSAWLESKRHELRTVPVSYVRGEATVVLQATIGRTVFEQQGEYGVLERTESRDFLVRTEDLVLEGTATLPERGDRVRETDGGKAFVYEVMAPGKEPQFRWSDPYRRTLRIHTKQVDVEEA
jgi:hypothetical protein